MPRDHAMEVARFPSTQWSLVGRAGHITGSRRRDEPSWQFTLVWARQVVEEARRRMEAHCRQVDRPDLWLVFNERILRPAANNTARPAHEQIAIDLKLESSKAACNLLITAKRLFARVMRSVVGEYVSDQRGIDDEIQDLMRILSQHG